MIKQIRIPKERLKIIKKVKMDIERLGNVKIDINGEILLSGNSINVFNTGNVITAIGRGFSFGDASKLFGDYILYVLPISKNKKTLYRVKARIIGTSGKIKKRIESLTDTKISVYGKTVSIIGKGEKLEEARTAIEKIISGKSHSTVFKFLENLDREI